MILMIVLACGCSKEFDSEENINGKKISTVKFTLANVDGALTKATTAYLPQGEHVGISAYAVPLSNVESMNYTQSKKFTVSDAVGTITSDDGKDMSVSRNANYIFYAYSPALDFNTDSKKKISIANGTDFKVASIAGTMTTVIQTLSLPALSRKCSYAEFVITCSQGTYVKSVSIGSNGLTFNNMTHSPIDYLLGSGEINQTGLALDASINIPKSSLLSTDGGINFIGGTPVLPKADNPFTVNLDINLTSAPNGDNILSTIHQTMTATIPHIAFVPGYKYRFSLQFSDPRVVLVLQVLPWTEINAVNNQGEGTGSVVVGSWNITKTWATNTGVGLSALSINDWTINTTGNTDMGQ